MRTMRGASSSRAPPTACVSPSGPRTISAPSRMIERSNGPSIAEELNLAPAPNAELGKRFPLWRAGTRSSADHLRCQDLIHDAHDAGDLVDDAPGAGGIDKRLEHVAGFEQVATLDCCEHVTALEGAADALAAQAGFERDQVLHHHRMKQIAGFHLIGAPD